MKFLINGCILFFLISGLNGQNIDSLKINLKNYSSHLKDIESDTTESWILLQLAQGTTNRESLFYYELLKKLSEKKLKQLPEKSKLIEFHEKRLALFYNEAGLLYRESGQVLKALDCFQKGIVLDEKISSSELSGANYNNIALVYHDIGEDEKAAEYFEKGLFIALKMKDTVGMTYGMINLGFAYYSANKLSKAYQKFKTCYYLAKIKNNKIMEASALERMGRVNAKQGDYKRALHQYQVSLDISEKINYLQGKVSNLFCIGDCYRLKKNYKEALKFATKSFLLNKELGSFEFTRANAYILKEINKNLGNYNEALTMFKLYRQLLDSTNNRSNREAARKNEIKFTSEKEAIILSHEAERLKQVYEQKKKFYFIIGLILLALILIVFLLLYLRYKFKKENSSKKILIQLKELLKREKVEKENIANSLIFIQELERGKLAAELHDGVNQILFAAKMQIQTAKSVQDEAHVDGIKLVETAIGEINSIAEDQGSFLLKNKLLKDALENLVQRMTGNQKLEIVFSNYGLQENGLSENQKINTLRIIQELLNNALRHSFATHCNIAVKTGKSHLLFSVTDNGIGIDYNVIRYGSGLKNISNKVSLMNGCIKTFSIPKKGTKIYVKIPIK